MAIVINVMGYQTGTASVTAANHDVEFIGGVIVLTERRAPFEIMDTLPPWNMNDPWFYRGYDFDPRIDYALPPKWLQEQRQIPRRMKRPFPKNAPGPKTCHRRGAY